MDDLGGGGWMGWLGWLDDLDGWMKIG